MAVADSSFCFRPNHFDDDEPVLPILPSQQAQIAIPSAIFARGRTLGILRLNSEWREAVGLSFSQIFLAIRNAKCITDSQQEPHCPRCVPTVGTPIVHVTVETEDPAYDGSLTELYYFSVLSRFKDSYGVGALFLTISLPCGRVLSPSFELKARIHKMPKSKQQKMPLMFKKYTPSNITQVTKRLPSPLQNEAYWLPSVRSWKIAPSVRSNDLANFFFVLGSKISGTTFLRVIRTTPVVSIFPGKDWVCVENGDRVFVSVWCYSNVEYAEKGMQITNTGRQKNLVNSCMCMALFTNW